MLFATYWFVAFALIVVPAYWLLGKARRRLPFLGIASAVFHYHFAGPAGVLPILALGLVTYFCARSRRPGACAAGIVLSVASLALYKYTHFLAGEVLALVSPAWGAAAEAAVKPLVPALPPLGLSFFTFEFVHYLIEVRRGGEPIRSPLQFVLFAIFFPSLVAGPIKRYGQFVPALQDGATTITEADVFAGVRRIALGFLKKVVIADNLSLVLAFYAPTVDPLTPFGTLSLLWRWVVFLMLALRILMDFSGYSDIAIGLARLLGVKLPENFNWPYAARSIQEFWQRWHISLSSWIRDYVYIPLGGNRHGVARKILNGLVAFALIGLWHGGTSESTWHFVVWGLYHGVGLALCANYTAIPFLGRRLESTIAAHRFSSWAATQLFVWFGWLLFFYPVKDALGLARLLFHSSPAP
jgi:alginate O-acetyltransferase complex protein AlgI